MRTATILVLLACLAGCQESPMPSGYEYLKFGEKQEVILKALGGSREVVDTSKGVDVVHETKLIDDDRFDTALLGFKDGRFIGMRFYVPEQKCGEDMFYALVWAFDLKYGCRTEVYRTFDYIEWSHWEFKNWANWADCSKKDPDVGVAVVWDRWDEGRNCEIVVSITDRS